MSNSSLDIIHIDNKLFFKFKGELTLFNISSYQKKIDLLQIRVYEALILDFRELKFLDSAAGIFIYNLKNFFLLKNIKVDIECSNKDILNMLALVDFHKSKPKEILYQRNISFIEKIGQNIYNKYMVFLSFLAFFGEIFVNKIHYIISFKSIRYKEIFFEANESGVKALGIITITSFLIGLVIAYQSAYQLKMYGANIFIVDMLGLSILRELSPLITAIVIAGRSGSAYTAQIGAMKITQELDAMRTMGFDPYKFLVLPRIIALMLIMPILIFVSDIMALVGGMIIANIDLDISINLFLNRFSDVIAAKHFFVGVTKGIFFAFLIASISIYRGFDVKDDTQSIGLNTTKSVVESIFAVIACDAIFSILFTKLEI